MSKTKKDTPQIEKLELNYFYGDEADKYKFYRVPAILFTDVRFKAISTESKLLYGFMLDRTSLSKKNHWVDKNGKIFIYYKQAEAQEQLNIGHSSVTKIFTELTNIGLIERKKQGQGKQEIIYVKNFASLLEQETQKDLHDNKSNDDANKPNKNDEKNQSAENQQSEENETDVLTTENQMSEKQTSSFPNTDVKTPSNQHSRNTNNSSQESYKSDSLYNNLSKKSIPELFPLSESNQSNHSESNDTIDNDMISDEKRKTIEEEVDEQLGFSYIKSLSPSDMFYCTNINMFEEIYNIICDVLLTTEPTIRIQKMNIPAVVVKNRFRALTYNHVIYAINKITTTSSTIHNMKAYMITVLYNAPTTMTLEDNAGAFE
jgi:hypothetical protein